MTTYAIGATWRTKNTTRGRVSYHPEWDAALPYVIYVDGAARIHRGSLAAASAWLWEHERLTLDTTSEST